MLCKSFTPCRCETVGGKSARLRDAGAILLMTMEVMDMAGKSIKEIALTVGVEQTCWRRMVLRM